MRSSHGHVQAGAEPALDLRHAASAIPPLAGRGCPLPFLTVLAPQSVWLAGDDGDSSR